MGMDFIGGMRMHKSAWHLSLTQAVHRDIVAQAYKLLSNQNLSREGQLPYAAVSGTVQSGHGDRQITASRTAFGRHRRLELSCARLRSWAVEFQGSRSHSSILSSC